MTTQTAAEKAHISFVVDAVIDLNGEDAEYIGQRMNSAFGSAIGNGALTGDTGAEVDEFSARTLALSPEAAAIDQEQLATWLSLQIESGSMPLESLARTMARYALTHPAEMREELAERMRAGEQDAVPVRPRQGGVS